jgi:hypothetical protein
MSKRLVAVAATLPLVLCTARFARAYRPFDGTDAAVAGVGEFELELGPAQWLRRADRSYILAPATVLNLGLAPGTELVTDFNNVITNGPLMPGEPRVRLLDTDVFLKHVFREGSLQGGLGPSIAAEGGPLIPEINGVEQLGAALDLIVSQACPYGTVHFNEQARYTRLHNLGFFSGMILEGPHQWLVRPVGEIFYEQLFNEVSTWSGLLGVIVTMRESLALDAAVRVARIGQQDATEIRFGFTLLLPVWTSTQPAASRQR